VSQTDPEQADLDLVRPGQAQGPVPVWTQHRPEPFNKKRKEKRKEKKLNSLKLKKLL